MVLMVTGKGDVTISMDDENLLKLMTGQLDPQQVSITAAVVNLYHYICSEIPCIVGGFYFIIMFLSVCNVIFAVKYCV